MPKSLAESRREEYGVIPEDFEVAASIQQALSASFTHILKRLKAAGVSQRTIAAEMGWDETIISRIKRGSYDPSLRTLERLRVVLNSHVQGEGIQPADLFRDPVDLLRSEAEKLGYDVVKRS